jgi:hypothetical protein
MVSALFAYIASLLLSLLQSCYLAVLLGLGKICIVLTLLPNVKLGWSWAKSLAQVAAWSKVAAIITGLLGSHTVAIRDLIVSGRMMPLLEASAHFVIYAILMLAVPMLVARAWSGAAPGLGEAALGFAAATGLSRRAAGATVETGKAAGAAAKGTYQGGKALVDGVRDLHGHARGKMAENFMKTVFPVRPEPKEAARGPAKAAISDDKTPIVSPREQQLRALASTRPEDGGGADYTATPPAPSPRSAAEDATSPGSSAESSSQRGRS